VPQQVYEIKDPQSGVIYEAALDHLPAPDEARTIVRHYRALDVAKSAPLSMRPPSENDPVTLGDWMDNPMSAAQRAGRVLKNDLTDPRMWAGLAASVIVPRVAGAVAPALASGAQAIGRGAMKAGGAALDVSPDLVGIASPRAGNMLRTAQRARDAITARGAAPAEAPSPAAPASTPAPAGPPPPSVPAESRPAMSPQRLQNELGLAARRAQVKLSEPEYQQAAELVKGGQAPADAVQAVAQKQAPRPHLSGPEVQLYLKLRASGKSDADAVAALTAMRAMNERFGLKTPTIEETKFPKGMRGNVPSKPQD